MAKWQSINGNVDKVSISMLAKYQWQSGKVSMAMLTKWQSSIWQSLCECYLCGI
ncbi:hypothetical protein ACS0TY_002520 [Phlomoides rotata]